MCSTVAHWIIFLQSGSLGQLQGQIKQLRPAFFQSGPMVPHTGPDPTIKPCLAFPLLINRVVGAFCVYTLYTCFSSIIFPEIGNPNRCYAPQSNSDSVKYAFCRIGLVVNAMQRQVLPTFNESWHAPSLLLSRSLYSQSTTSRQPTNQPSPMQQTNSRAVEARPGRPRPQTVRRNDSKRRRHLEHHDFWVRSERSIGRGPSVF